MKYFAISLFLTCFLACKTDDKGACEEELVPDCVTTMHFDPVCGCNGKTYSNSGEAYCHGIEGYTEGACPD
jgi:hypothetical protein